MHRWDCLTAGRRHSIAQCDRNSAPLCSQQNSPCVLGQDAAAALASPAGCACAQLTCPAVGTQGSQHPGQGRTWVIARWCSCTVPYTESNTVSLSKAFSTWPTRACKQLMFQNISFVTKLMKMRRTCFVSLSIICLDTSLYFPIHLFCSLIIMIIFEADWTGLLVPMHGKPYRFLPGFEFEGIRNSWEKKIILWFKITDVSGHVIHWQSLFSARLCGFNREFIGCGCVSRTASARDGNPIWKWPA